MKIATPFIEYLIIGTHMCSWIVLMALAIMGKPLSAVNSLTPALLALLLPFIYLLGMLCDSAFYPLLNRYRKEIRDSIIDHKTDKDELIAHSSPELYSAYETRVRRVRIVGAAIFNWPLVGVGLLLHAGFASPRLYLSVILSSVTLCCLCIFVWKSLFRRAYSFRKNAIDIIHKHGRRKEDD